MTLTEIKNKIVEQIKKLTIDDFYSAPDVIFPKAIFTKLTKMKTDEEIEKYLMDRFPETNIESIKFSISKSINDFNEQILTIEKEVNGSACEIQVLKDELVEILEKQIPALTVAEKNVKFEISELEEEIHLLKPLKDKYDYKDKIEELNTRKEVEKEKLKEYEASKKMFSTENKISNAKINALNDANEKRKLEIEKIHASIAKKQSERGVLEEKEHTHQKVESESLEFLFKVILHKSIRTSEEYKHVETGESDWHGNPKTKYVKTGDLILNASECDIEEVNRFISTFTNRNRTIPKDWRKIIYDTLSKPLPNISGLIQNPAKNENYNKFEDKIKEDKDLFFVLEPETLSSMDRSALLALRIAARAGQSIKTEDNYVTLCLSGGLSATISFREKGEIISKIQKKNLEIFVNYLKFKLKRADGEITNLGEFRYEILYYQFGYANSTVNVRTPGAYYIIEDKYVIEIHFNAAPILFDNNSVAKFAPNVSGKALLDEEERQRQEDDDYYYDNY